MPRPASFVLALGLVGCAAVPPQPPLSAQGGRVLVIARLDEHGRLLDLRVDESVAADGRALACMDAIRLLHAAIGSVPSRAGDTVVVPCPVGPSPL